MVLRPILPKETPHFTARSAVEHGMTHTDLVHSAPPSPVHPVSQVVAATFHRSAPLPTDPLRAPSALVQAPLQPRPDLHKYFGPEMQGGLRPLDSPHLFTEVTVKSGDTLYGLAQRHGVPAEYIAAASGLQDIHNLKAGQRVSVPHPVLLDAPQMVQVANIYGNALKHYDQRFAQYQQERKAFDAQVQAQQAQARDFSKQAGLPAGMLPLELGAGQSNSNAAPLFQASSQVPSRKGKPADLSDQFPKARPELSDVFANPNFVTPTTRSRTRDRFDASIHNHLANNSGAFEALSGAYQTHQAQLQQDTSLMGKVARFLDRSAETAITSHPLFSALAQVARRPEWEQYFRTKRIQHEAKADELHQQIQLKGGVNEWSQVNVSARGWGDLVNYGEWLVLGTLPVLAEAAIGGAAGRGVFALGQMTRAGVPAALTTTAQTLKASQLAGTLGMLEATTLSSLGSLLEAQRDQTGGLIDLPSAVALTPLFVAANTLGITARLAKGTTAQNVIGQLDRIPGVTGFFTRTVGNMGLLSLSEGAASLYQDGVVSQWARMKVDGQETFFNARNGHRSYEALAGGMFIGGLFGAGGGRRSRAPSSVMQPSFANSTTLAAQEAVPRHLRLVVDNTREGTTDLPKQRVPLSVWPEAVQGTGQLRFAAPRSDASSVELNTPNGEQQWLSSDLAHRTYVALSRASPQTQAALALFLDGQTSSQIADALQRTQPSGNPVLPHVIEQQLINFGQRALDTADLHSLRNAIKRAIGGDAAATVHGLIENPGQWASHYLTHVKLMGPSLADLNPAELHVLLHQLELMNESDSTSASTSDQAGDLRPATLSSMMDDVADALLRKKLHEPNVRHMLLVLSGADAFTRLLLQLYVGGLSMQKISDAISPPGKEISINVIRKRLGQISERLFETPELEVLRPRVLQTLDKATHKFFETLVQYPRHWSRQYLGNLHLYKADLDVLEANELRVLIALLNQHHSGQALDRPAVGQVVKLHPGTVYENENGAYKKLNIQTLDELQTRYDSPPEALVADLNDTLKKRLEGHAARKDVPAPRDAFAAYLMALDDARLSYLHEFLSNGTAPEQITRTHGVNPKNVRGLVERLGDYLTEINPSTPARLGLTAQIKALYPESSISAAAFVYQLIHHPENWAQNYYRGPALDLNALNTFSDRDFKLLLSFISKIPADKLAKHWGLEKNHISYEKRRLLTALGALSLPDLLRRSGGTKKLLEHLQSLPLAQQVLPARHVLHTDTWAMAQLLGVEVATSKQHIKEGWMASVGTPKAVTIPRRKPRSKKPLIRVHHVHLDAATNATQRMASPEDLVVANEARSLLSIGIGPRDHHKIYYGKPENALPLNARVINELEHTRREISAAVHSTPPMQWILAGPILYPKAVFKNIDGVGVLRLTHITPKLIKQVTTWAKTQPALHALRIEMPGNEKPALELSGARQTLEDFYDIHSGEFDLNHTLAVATLPLRQTLEQADQQIKTLGTAARAYAFQSLYFDGHRAYERSGVSNAVNLKGVLRRDRPELVAQGEAHQEGRHTGAYQLSAPDDFKPQKRPTPTPAEQDQAARAMLTSPHNANNLGVLLDFLKQIQAAHQRNELTNAFVDTLLQTFSSRRYLLEAYAVQLRIKAVDLPARLSRAFASGQREDGLAALIEYLEATVPKESKALNRHLAEQASQSQVKSEATPPSQRVSESDAPSPPAVVVKRSEPLKVPKRRGRPPSRRVLPGALPGGQGKSTPVWIEVSQAQIRQGHIERLSTELDALDRARFNELTAEQKRLLLRWATELRNAYGADVVENPYPVDIANDRSYEIKGGFIRKKLSVGALFDVKLVRAGQVQKKVRESQASKAVEANAHHETAPEVALPAWWPALERFRADLIQHISDIERAAAQGRTRAGADKKKSSKAHQSDLMWHLDRIQPDPNGLGKKTIEIGELRDAPDALQSTRELTSTGLSNTAQAITTYGSTQALPTLKTLAEADLTNTELRVLAYLMAGRGGEQIAHALNFETVQEVVSVERGIAKKMGLTQPDMVGELIARYPNPDRFHDGKQQHHQQLYDDLEALLGKEALLEIAKPVSRYQRMQMQDDMATRRSAGATVASLLDLTPIDRQGQPLTKEGVNELSFNGILVLDGLLSHRAIEEIAAQTGLTVRAVEAFSKVIPAQLGVTSLVELKSLYAGGGQRLSVDVEHIARSRIWTKNKRAQKAVAKEKKAPSVTYPTDMTALSAAVARGLAALPDEKVRALWAYVEGGFSSEEIGLMVGMPGIEVNAILNNIPKQYVEGEKRAAIELMIQSQAKDGENIRDVMWQLMVDRRAWVRHQPGMSVMTEADLIQASQKLTDPQFNLLTYWVKYPFDSAALAQASGLTRTSIDNFKFEIRRAFGVSSISELGLRTPGGLHALVGYLRWRRQVARQPQADLQRVPESAPEILAPLIIGASRSNSGKKGKGSDQGVGSNAQAQGVAQKEEVLHSSVASTPGNDDFDHSESPRHVAPLEDSGVTPLLNFTQQAHALQPVALYSLSENEAGVWLNLVTAALNAHRAQKLQNPSDLPSASLAPTGNKFAYTAQTKLGLDEGFIEAMQLFLEHADDLPLPVLKELLRWKFGKGLKEAVGDVEALSLDQARKHLGDTNPVALVENLRLDLIRHLRRYYPAPGAPASANEVNRLKSALDPYPQTSSLSRADLEGLLEPERYFLAHLWAGRTQAQIAAMGGVQASTIKKIESQLRNKLHIKHPDTIGEVLARYDARYGNAETDADADFYGDLEALIGQARLRDDVVDLQGPLRRSLVAMGAQGHATASTPLDQVPMYPWMLEAEARQSARFTGDGEAQSPGRYASKDEAAAHAAIQRLLGLADERVEAISLYLEGLELGEVQARTGLGSDALKKLFATLSQPYASNDWRSGLEQFVQTAAAPNQSSANVLQQRLQARNAWARERLGLNLWTEEELTHRVQRLTRDQRTVLRYWVEHQNDPSALRDIMGMKQDAIDQHKSKIRSVLGVSSIDEAGYRTPGGLHALGAFLEWSNLAAWQPQAALDIGTPAARPGEALVTASFSAPQGLRQPEPAQQTVRAHPEWIDFSAVWQQQPVEQLITKQDRTFAGGHATWVRTGDPDHVQARLHPLRLHMAMHTHVRGPFDPEARVASSDDMTSAAQINADRMNAGKSPLQFSVRIGPDPLHAHYFNGVPGYSLTPTAQVVNHLEDTRREITAAVGATQETSLSDPTAGVHLKVMQGTAVLRFDAFPSADTIAAVLKQMQRISGVHTLRLEVPGASPKALNMLLQPEARAAAYATHEEFYRFDTGQYNLTQRMAVVSVALGQTRQQADEHAPLLSGVDRAYAFQTLVHSGQHKTYDTKDGINLRRFLGPARSVSAPKVSAAPSSDGWVDAVWRSSPASVRDAQWWPGQAKDPDKSAVQALWEKHGSLLGINSVEEYISKAHEVAALPVGGPVHRMERVDGSVVTYLSDKNWWLVERDGLPYRFHFVTFEGQPSGEYHWQRQQYKEPPVALRQRSHYELALAALRTMDVKWTQEGIAPDQIAKDLFRMRWRLEWRMHALAYPKQAYESRQLQRQGTDVAEDLAYQRLVAEGASAEKIIAIAKGADLYEFGLNKEARAKKEKRFTRWASSDAQTSPAESAWTAWTQHAAEFPQFFTIHQYIEAAYALAQTRLSLNVRRLNLSSGDVVTYDQKQGLWLVTQSDGVPKAFFRVTEQDGSARWNELLVAEGIESQAAQPIQAELEDPPKLHEPAPHDNPTTQELKQFQTWVQSHADVQALQSTVKFLEALQGQGGFGLMAASERLRRMLAHDKYEIQKVADALETTAPALPRALSSLFSPDETPGLPDALQYLKAQLERKQTAAKEAPAVEPKQVSVPTVDVRRAQQGLYAVLANGHIDWLRQALYFIQQDSLARPRYTVDEVATRANAVDGTNVMHNMQQLVQALNPAASIPSEHAALSAALRQAVAAAHPASWATSAWLQNQLLHNPGKWAQRNGFLKVYSPKEIAQRLNAQQIELLKRLGKHDFDVERLVNALDPQTEAAEVRAQEIRMQAQAVLDVLGYRTWPEVRFAYPEGFDDLRVAPARGRPPKATAVAAVVPKPEPKAAPKAAPIAPEPSAEAAKSSGVPIALTALPHAPLPPVTVVPIEKLIDALPLPPKAEKKSPPQKKEKKKEKETAQPTQHTPRVSAPPVKREPRAVTPVQAKPSPVVVDAQSLSEFSQWLMDFKADKVYDLAPGEAASLLGWVTDVINAQAHSNLPNLHPVEGAKGSIATFPSRVRQKIDVAMLYDKSLRAPREASAPEPAWLPDLQRVRAALIQHIERHPPYAYSVIDRLRDTRSFKPEEHTTALLHLSSYGLRPQELAVLRYLVQGLHHGQMVLQMMKDGHLEVPSGFNVNQTTDFRQIDEQTLKAALVKVRGFEKEARERLGLTHSDTAAELISRYPQEGNPGERLWYDLNYVNAGRLGEPGDPNTPVQPALTPERITQLGSGVADPQAENDLQRIAAYQSDVARFLGLEVLQADALEQKLAKVNRPELTHLARVLSYVLTKRAELPWDSAAASPFEAADVSRFEYNLKKALGLPEYFFVALRTLAQGVPGQLLFAPSNLTQPMTAVMQDAVKKIHAELTRRDEVSSATAMP